MVVRRSSWVRRYTTCKKSPASHLEASRRSRHRTFQLYAFERNQNDFETGNKQLSSAREGAILLINYDFFQTSARLNCRLPLASFSPVITVREAVNGWFHRMTTRGARGDEEARHAAHSSSISCVELIIYFSGFNNEQ
jgi:hypothetical protein